MPEDERRAFERWSRPTTIGWGITALVGVLICATSYGLLSLVRAQREVRELVASRDGVAAALSQTRDRLEGLEVKLNALNSNSAPPATVAAPSPARPPAPAPARAVRTAARRPVARKPPEDPRWARVRTQLSDQEKQIAATRQELEKSGADLRGQVDSTRTELNGSIARNHDELVQLQKQGESTFHEFTLSRSKTFQHVGPIGISVHKVNLKHRYFDLSMMVDDFKLDKKHVNLYEPVWINLSDRPQPVELVVNRIDKNQVQGYIREPKYKKSELAASASGKAKPESLQTR